MIQKLKMLLLSAGSIFVLALPAVATAAVSQDTINNNLCGGSNGLLQGQSDQSGCGNDATKSANSLVTTIINILSVVVGVIAVIMIIVAGLRYVTSGGKQESVTGAKNTILYAVIGLVIVALAQIIVHFVLNKTTSATGTTG